MIRVANFKRRGVWCLVRYANFRTYCRICTMPAGLSRSEQAGILRGHRIVLADEILHDAPKGVKTAAFVDLLGRIRADAAAENETRRALGLPLRDPNEPSEADKARIGELIRNVLIPARTQ